METVEAFGVRFALLSVRDRAALVDAMTARRKALAVNNLRLAGADPGAVADELAALDRDDGERDLEAFLNSAAGQVEALRLAALKAGGADADLDRVPLESDEVLPLVARLCGMRVVSRGAGGGPSDAPGSAGATGTSRPT
mgnify:CR=1 FL=1